MSWLRIDDGYDTHPKLLELTEQQRWRWTRVLIHCARHKTEGHVKTSVLRELGLSRTVTRLLGLGLLEQNGEEGYLVHDWSTFNPKDPTKAERQARWRHKQVSTPASTETAAVDGLVDGEIVHSRAGTRARPVPSPQELPPVLPAEVKDPPNGRTAGRPNEIEAQRLEPAAILAAAHADDDIPL